MRHAARKGSSQVLVMLALLTAAGLTGCSSAPKSSRMTAADMTDMAQAMASSLAQSETVRQRTPQSPRWVIAIQKVENLTQDVMTESEQWGVMARLQGSLPITALYDQRNIRFVIPAERTRAIRQQPDLKGYEQAFGGERAPTHVMTATFRSATRADARNRSDYYYCDFVMQELASGQTVWNDRFEYKRIAKGHVWD